MCNANVPYDCAPPPPPPADYELVTRMCRRRRCTTPLGEILEIRPADEQRAADGWMERSAPARKGPLANWPGKTNVGDFPGARALFTYNYKIRAAAAAAALPTVPRPHRCNRRAAPVSGPLPLGGVPLIRLASERRATGFGGGWSLGAQYSACPKQTYGYHDYTRRLWSSPIDGFRAGDMGAMQPLSPKRETGSRNGCSRCARALRYVLNFFFN